MQTRKPSGLITASGLLKLVGHAAMGVAMGLAFALLVILIDPSGSATLIEHGATLVLTFAIGATLTGAVFIITEDT